MDKRSRRRFTKEFKAETVVLVRQSGKSIAEICRDMGLSESSVHRRLAQAEIDAGQRDGLTTAERDELSHLRRELRIVREERDLLAKAITFFTKGTDAVSRHRFIAEETVHHSVALLCRVLRVADSALYAWQTQQPSARARADDHVINEIKAIHDDSRWTYCAPRVHAELRRRGKRVGRKRRSAPDAQGWPGRPLPAPISADDKFRPDDARAGPRSRIAVEGRSL